MVAHVRTWPNFIPQKSLARMASATSSAIPPEVHLCGIECHHRVLRRMGGMHMREPRRSLSGAPVGDEIAAMTAEEPGRGRALSCHRTRPRRLEEMSCSPGGASLRTAE